jgi:Flp pilus assembly protein TadG
MNAMETKWTMRFRLCRSLGGERGQVIPILLVMMLTLFGVCGFVIDAGRLYLSYQELQASTDAAALAGGFGLQTSGSAAQTYAEEFDSVTGGNNVFSNLSGVTLVTSPPTVKCISYTYVQIPCATSSGTYNAIQVQQTVSVPMTFARFFGAKSVTLTATSTAAEYGGNSTPYNIALIIDTTNSMGKAGSDSCTDPISGASYTTSIKCALVGAKILLLNTAPCASNVSTCPGTASNSVDMISLFTFPNGEASTMANDYSNGCKGPTITSTYTYPELGTAYTPSGTAANYQVTTYQSTYRTSDTSSTLNSSSDLTLAIGQGSDCAGLQTPGGLGTYYAGALAAAQQTLAAQQALSGRTGSQNAIILLSDGQANATLMATTDVNGKSVSATASTYPSQINECQQAVNIASTISATGTKIYVVAYGSPTTTSSKNSGCETDSSGTNKWIAPCTAMSEIATSASTFFVDDPAGTTSGCTSAQNPETGLSNIFQKIAYGFTNARLIPNSVFSEPTS